MDIREEELDNPSEYHFAELYPLILRGIQEMGNCIHIPFQILLYVLMMLSLMAECLLRADRLYSCMLLLVIVFIVRIIRNTKARKRVLAAMLLICFVVVGNMEANYSDFSEEIKNTITLEDAKTFDSHNNNVMYQMAPLVEEKGYR